MSRTCADILADQRRLFGKLNPLVLLQMRIEPYKNKFPGLYARTHNKVVQYLAEYGDLSHELAAKYKRKKV